MLTRRTIALAAFVGALVVVAGRVAWAFLLLPSSLTEHEFRTRLSQLATTRNPQALLASLLPSPTWELACESHGYDGDLRLKKYNRTYPPAAPPQDGVWGLIFIERDGSYTPVVGSCTRGGAMLRLPQGCVGRSATLNVRDQGGSCPEYVSDERQ